MPRHEAVHGGVAGMCQSPGDSGGGGKCLQKYGKSKRPVSCALMVLGLKFLLWEHRRPVLLWGA
jgi:hypothetical protein